MRATDIILLIEVDDVDREFIHRLIGDMYEIREANTAADGLRLARKLMPACTLLDSLHSDADGMELLPELESMSTAVIVLAGHGHESIAAEATKTGSHYYVAKSGLNRDNLLQAIRNAMQRSVLCRQLRERMTVLEQFTYTVAHELKAPLCHIARFADRLAVEHANALSADALLDVRGIQRSAQESRQLINDLLSLAEVNWSTERVEAVDLCGLLIELTRDYDEILSQSAGQIIISDLPLVFGDRRLLSQLFRNLIDNSLKYRGDAPPVVQVFADSAVGHHRISVSDNGIGVAPKYLGEMFKPFRRLQPQSEYEGSGLGLAICQHIVARHGGTIRAESDVNRGTTICFTLPQSSIAKRSHA